MSNQESGIVAYDGICHICGASDGTILRCFDGKYRNMCHTKGCPVRLKPAPGEGHNSLEVLSASLRYAKREEEGQADD